MERNLDNLLPLVQKLCDDINELHIKEFPTLTEYHTYFEVARKYVKVITNTGNQLTVWGFINKSNPKFEMGTVLKAAGWATPTLNAGRGDLFEGYEIKGMRKYGPDYLI